ncbi:hypothetical protein EJ07DRAFT_158955 [Lizonia empirigonia]|nr:hypothetical protein EJ07DRAFT_158955 [Lizonia empirigonia]
MTTGRCNPDSYLTALYTTKQPQPPLQLARASKHVPSHLPASQPCITFARPHIPVLASHESLPILTADLHRPKTNTSHSFQVLQVAGRCSSLHSLDRVAPRCKTLQGWCRGDGGSFLGHGRTEKSRAITPGAIPQNLMELEFLKVSVTLSVHSYICLSS